MAEGECGHASLHGEVSMGRHVTGCRAGGMHPRPADVNEAEDSVW